MADLFKCKKCGKQLGNKHEYENHEKVCKGAVVSMETIQLIAEKGIEGLVSPAEICFKCVICGGSQIISEAHNWGKEIVFPICDNCKSDLKEIILTKRKKK